MAKLIRTASLSLNIGFCSRKPTQSPPILMRIENVCVPMFQTTLTPARMQAQHTVSDQIS